MSSDLVPVFIPPLATLLAVSERQAGRPLSETEVLEVRDRSTVVMMRPGDADEMTASRGFRDVDPEDCWADWHRLRVEYTGKGYLPKIVLCLTGDAPFADVAREFLTAKSIEHEVRGRDGRMLESFRASLFRASPPATKEELAAIERHESVVYVLSKNFGAGAALSEAQRMLELGVRLLELGGVAMKCESSGIAHGREQWLQFAKSVYAATPA